MSRCILRREPLALLPVAKRWTVGLGFLAALTLATASSPVLAHPTAHDERTASVEPADGPNSAALAQERRLSALRGAVLRSLRSPGTARFRGEFLSASPDSKAYALCGWVDAEDPAGHRLGAVAFIAKDDGAVLYAVSDPYGSFPHLWRTNCAYRTTHRDNRMRTPGSPGEARDTRLAAAFD